MFCCILYSVFVYYICPGGIVCTCVCITESVFEAQPVHENLQFNIFVPIYERRKNTNRTYSSRLVRTILQSYLTFRLTAGFPIVIFTFLRR